MLKFITLGTDTIVFAPSKNSIVARLCFVQGFCMLYTLAIINSINIWYGNNAYYVHTKTANLNALDLVHW